MTFLRQLWAAKAVALPAYVTREAADGQIAVWSVNAIWGLFIWLALCINVTLWSVYGIIHAVEAIF